MISESCLGTTYSTTRKGGKASVAFLIRTMPALLATRLDGQSQQVAPESIPAVPKGTTLRLTPKAIQFAARGETQAVKPAPSGAASPVRAGVRAQVALGEVCKARAAFMGNSEIAVASQVAIDGMTGSTPALPAISPAAWLARTLPARVHDAHGAGKRNSLTAMPRGFDL
jgi:hypothetical protein